MCTDIFDSHCHSINSHDGHSSIYDICEIAINRGIKGFSITDHCEVDLYDCDYKKSIDRSFRDTELAKEKYKNKIVITSGIELGQANYNLELSKEILKKHSYDFIIASTHGIDNNGDLCKISYNKMSENEIYKLLEEYFEYYLNMVKKCDFDVAAHLTYPLRYIEGIYKIKIDLCKFDIIIDEIFKVIIERKKALEINTSGLRQKIKKTFPSNELILRYRELGGELITIGSDSHKAVDLASDFTQTIELLKHVGFRKYFYYKKRKAIEIFFS